MNKALLATLILFSTSIFAQTWEAKSNAPVGRHHPISFSLNGKGYAITGTLPSGQPTKDAYQYNPTTDTWLTMPSFPGAARSFGIGTVTNGVAYMGFGFSTSQYLRDFWSLDSNGTYTQLASCDCTGRRHPAMIGIGDKIYVGLGDDASGDLRDWWMYDIKADNWTQITSLPSAGRHHPFMFNAGGEVFAGLGHRGNVIYDDWFKLDTATNTWTAMNKFPGEARVAGTQFGMHGYGFVLSGDGDNHGYMPNGEMWRYNPKSDTWTQFPSHPGQSRWAPGSFVIGDDVYFFGGLNRLTNVFPTDLWKFDMAAATVSMNEEVLANTYVYPNPATDILKWKSDESITEVKVYNTLGQLVSASPAEAQSLNSKELDGGMYLVQFYSNSELIKTSKVLIQN
ncbi:T9SS type A sorting domain-containing protein [Owenweeksia hongkongensis]|uniref:T9SS type A sorting domain-containing protein n=1 Tax=Owenweeksia hongkongensis TaxID=253245 RepID=UPI003A8D35D4